MYYPMTRYELFRADVDPATPDFRGGCVASYHSEKDGETEFYEVSSPVALAQIIAEEFGYYDAEIGVIPHKRHNKPAESVHEISYTPSSQLILIKETLCHIRPFNSQERTQFEQALELIVRKACKVRTTK